MANANNSSEENCISLSMDGDRHPFKKWIQKTTEEDFGRINLLNDFENQAETCCITQERVELDGARDQDPESAADNNGDCLQASDKLYRNRKNRYSDYLILATKELALAHVMFGYLLKQNQPTTELPNQAIASLYDGKCTVDLDTSTCNQNAHTEALVYYSITRMIDSLVVNSKKGKNKSDTNKEKSTT